MIHPNSILRHLHNPPAEYRPIALWFLNHRLEKTELVCQVAEMAKQGMGGLMLHSRNGLRTAYLKEEWRAALETAIEAAEHHGLQVWLYDENHYPSGTAGDQLPVRFPDRTMKSLAVLWEGMFDGGEMIEREIQGDALTYIAVAGSLEKPVTADLTTHLRAGRLRWKVPAAWGRTAVLVLGEIPWRAQPGHTFAYYPDYLDPELTDEFIALTHRWYHAAFGERFGKTIRGIFSDNSCGNFGHIRRSIPWGRDFEARFNRATGLKLRQILPSLFYSQAPDASRARLVFWRFFGQAYLTAYFKRITTYCTRVGLLSTGHLCLEEGMGEHARQIGDYFEVMRHFTLTAVDQLGPKTPGEDLTFSCGENLASCLKNTCSAARFTGSPRVMCESFGLSSAPWELDLFEMKRISGWMAAVGVDQFLPHGLFYSISGNRKWECTPDHLHNPLWQYYAHWTDWISRLCCASVDGVNRAEVAVLYPIHALRVGLELVEQTFATRTQVTSTDATNLQCSPTPSSRGAATDFIEATYTRTIEALLAEGIDFEVMDEEILASGRVGRDGSLRVPAPRKRDAAFRVLILPAMTVIERRSLPVLEQFTRAGGMLLFLNAVPSHAFDPQKGTLQPTGGLLTESVTPLMMDAAANRRVWEKAVEKGNMRLATIPPKGNREEGQRFLAEQLCDRVGRHITLETTDGSHPPIITRSWEKQGHRFYFAFNHSRQPIPSVRVKVAEFEPLTRIDLTTGKPLGWDGTVPHDFDPAEGLLLVTHASSRDKVDLPRNGRVLKIILIEGDWSFQTDHPNILPLKQWTTSVKDNTQSHDFTFHSEIDLDEAILLLDLERSNPELDAHAYGPRLSCWINEREVKDFQPGTHLDRNIYETKLAGMVRRGTNNLEIRAAACNVDWEPRLWPPMLMGHFSVADRVDPRLTPPSPKIETGSWVSQGYPFFAGEGSYARKLHLPSCATNERWMLDLGEIANAGRVAVDGREIGVRIAPPWTFDLTPYTGKTIELMVRVANTPHNLFMQEPLPAGLLGPVTLKKVEISL